MPRDHNIIMYERKKNKDTISMKLKNYDITLLSNSDFKRLLSVMSFSKIVTLILPDLAIPHKQLRT